MTVRIEKRGGDYLVRDAVISPLNDKINTIVKIEGDFSQLFFEIPVGKKIGRTIKISTTFPFFHLVDIFYKEDDHKNMGTISWMEKAEWVWKPIDRKSAIANVEKLTTIEE